LTIIDDAGRTVTIPKNPERIISIGSTWTETLYAIGCGDRVVGVCNDSNYPPEAADKPQVGTGSSLNLEKVLGLEPDLVVIWRYSSQAIDNLEKQGIPVVGLYPTSVDDIIDTIRLLGTITGSISEAAELTAEMQTNIDEIAAKTRELTKAQMPLVYYELYSPLKTTGPGTYTNELIFMAGGINLAADEPVKYPILSNEYIIERNPDVIIESTGGPSIEEVKTRSGWEGINAVKNDRVYLIDNTLVCPTPRIVLGLEQFAKWLHPELFGD